MTIRLALQIPNFSYGTGVSELFPTVIAQAQEAEAAGINGVILSPTTHITGYRPGGVAAVGEALKPLVSG